MNQDADQTRMGKESFRERMKIFNSDVISETLILLMSRFHSLYFHLAMLSTRQTLAIL